MHYRGADNDQRRTDRKPGRINLQNPEQSETQRHPPLHWRERQSDIHRNQESNPNRRQLFTSLPSERPATADCPEEREIRFIRSRERSIRTNRQNEYLCFHQLGYSLSEKTAVRADNRQCALVGRRSSRSKRV